MPCCFLFSPIQLLLLLLEYKHIQHDAEQLVFGISILLFSFLIKKLGFFCIMVVYHTIIYNLLLSLIH